MAEMLSLQEPVTPQTPTQQDSEKRRQYVIDEIVVTEKVYFEKLQALMDVFIKPLEEKNILSKEDMDLQFGGLKVIYQLHKEMYDTMVQNAESKTLNIGDLFIKFSSGLRDYKIYLVQYEPAIMRRGVLLTKNRKFIAFVENAASDPRCLGSDVESMLIAPVQRIPRYRLLLEDLLKYTGQDHPEYGALQESLRKVKEVANQNNEAIRMREKKEEIMAIMNKIDKGSRIDLLNDQERVVIRRGPLRRQCRREARNFDFYLFTDMLIYCEWITMSNAYKLKRQLPLIQCRTNEFPSVTEQPECAFAVESPAKSFIVWASTPEDKGHWIRDINNSIELLRYKLETEAGIIAPIWKPDTSCPECNICTSSFTFIRRRHHCRNCGSVVCNNCSLHRTKIAHVDKDNEVRVCNNCYEKLNNELYRTRQQMKSSVSIEQRMEYMFGMSTSDKGSTPRGGHVSNPSGKHDSNTNIFGALAEAHGFYRSPTLSSKKSSGESRERITNGAASPLSPRTPTSETS